MATKNVSRLQWRHRGKHHADLDLFHPPVLLWTMKCISSFARQEPAGWSRVRLEKLGTPKGMPNPVKLFNDILELGGEIVFCELALENKDIKPEDLRDPRIKIKKAPPF